MTRPFIHVDWLIYTAIIHQLELLGHFGSFWNVQYVYYHFIVALARTLLFTQIMSGCSGIPVVDVQQLL